jgi:hypothetical protein
MNMPTFGERLKHAWNAFTSRDPTQLASRVDIGPSYSYRPDHRRFTRGNERSIVTSLYNRISLDVSSITIKHARLDDNGNFTDTINSGLNNIFSTEANIDQTGRSFVQDIVMSMLDEGVVAVVPVDTTSDPVTNNAFDINTMRTGRIMQWYPQYVRVRLYNDRTGNHEEVTLPKKSVAIIENPLYSVMNEPNSTLQRLIRKLNILDAIDEQNGAGKLDLIIQLPYVIRSPQRHEQAEKRRKDIEMQLAGSKYGIAYTDGTEKITQLNRSVDNNLLAQIEYLTKMLYSQLGVTEEVFNGTADEKTMLNYHNRTIEPIISAITDEFSRKFLTKTARTQGQSIVFFREPFKLVPVNQIADIADKFTRNEILTSNEIRGIIGFEPSSDPGADRLQNSNLYQQDTGLVSGDIPEGTTDETDSAQEEENPMDIDVSNLTG